MKIFSVKLFLFLSFTLCLSLGIDAAYRMYFQRGFVYPKHLWKNPRRVPQYELVALGNSHAQSGITFEKFTVPAINLASVAQRFSLDLALLKQHQNEIAPNAIVLITVSPISFSHKPVGKTDSLQYNYFDSVSPLFIRDLSVEQYLSREVFSFLRAGALYRQYFQEQVTEQQRIANLAPTPPPTPVPTPSTSTVAKKQNIAVTKKMQKVLRVSGDAYFFTVEGIRQELARHSGVPAGAYQNNIDFLYNKWYKTDEFSPKYFEQNRKDLQELLSFILQKGWRPVLITLPLHEDIVIALEDDYLQTYLYDNLAKTDVQAAPYFDYMTKTGIQRDTFLFGNADHLNKHGAAVLSYFLLQDLIIHGYLDKTVDGYDYEPIYVLQEV